MAFQSDAAPRGNKLTKSAAVRLENIQKTLGGTRVLSGVSLDIKAGEFVTLLGPSGSGKTSTLMAVAGFIIADSGRITVGGRDVTRLPPGRERDMGIVFQNYALFPHMTVAKNVAYPLRVRGLPKAEIRERVERVLRLVRLDALADRKPARLSGGQQQRVALARALVFEPSVLLMDEPMGALDVRLKQELQWEIRQLQQTLGATVIYVTHDQNEAMLLSDRVALMKDGLIEQYGTPEELYRRPATLFAAEFLGESNLINCHYAPDVKGLRIPRTGFVIPATAAGGTYSTQGTYAALIRPEHASIIPEDELPATGEFERRGNTVVDGEVEEAVFMGQSMRYLVRVAALDTVLNVQQVAHAGDRELGPGSRVKVMLNPRDIHLIPVSEGATS